MQFKVEIDMSNAAFDAPLGRGCEIARLLREITRQIEELDIDEPRPERVPLHDINGNSVGYFAIEGED